MRSTVFLGILFALAGSAHGVVADDPPGQAVPGESQPTAEPCGCNELGEIDPAVLFSRRAARAEAGERRSRNRVSDRPPARAEGSGAPLSD